MNAPTPPLRQIDIHCMFNRPCFDRNYMSKSRRIGDLIASIPCAPCPMDPRYHAFVALFNEARYFDAHDVLEDLWLSEGGHDHRFYKALIQVAGAFVHLQKQHIRPNHHKDSRRLRPAYRLLRIAHANLEPYGPRHLALNVAALLEFLHSLSAEITDGDFRINPWNPENAPRLRLEIDYQKE